jgi:thioredoxin-like negative regulator of GroEL
MSARRRGTVLLLAGLCAAAGLAVWLYARGAEARNLRAARALAAAGELRRAQLLLEQRVQLRPESAAAHAALATFFDEVGAPVALEHWGRAVQFDPSDENRHHLAASALRHGRVAEARAALDGVSSAGRRRPDHLRIAAGVALAEGDAAQAEASLAALVAADPRNDRFRFALAAHRLATGRQVAESRRELEDLARRGPLRVRATLELMGDAPRRWPASPEPEVLLAQRLFEAEKGPVALRATAAPGRSRLVAHLTAPPSPEPADAAVLLGWFLREDRASDGLRWLQALPDEHRRHPAVVLPAAECAVRTRDWAQLRVFLQHGAWGVLASSALEEAFALRQAAPEGNSARWQALLQNPELTRGGLRILWRLAAVWGWESEVDLTLAAVARRFPRERWAWEELQQRLLRRGDTAELTRRYAAWVKENPDDTAAQLAQIIFGFLTDRGDQAMRAAAEQLRGRWPDDPAANVALALAWRAAGRPADAVALLDGVDARAWDAPRFALARGVLLAEVGRGEEALRVLSRVEEPLVPEERRLLAAARTRAAAGHRRIGKGRDFLRR